MVSGPATFLPRADLDRLIGALAADGRRVIGPTIVDGAVVDDEIETAAQLPNGVTARTGPGHYRLEAAGRARTFDHQASMTSPKGVLHPASVPLSVARREGTAIDVKATAVDPPRLALLGVRACDLAAVRIQDRAMRAGPLGDADHAARRDATFIVGVECARAAETCFCTSMGTGPEITEGADVVLSELDDGFVVRPASAAGETLIGGLGLRPAEAAEVAAAGAQVAAVRAAIGDPVATVGLPERLRGALDSPRWAEVAERCLACANCTLVCPTCFCTSVTVRSDLDNLESATERTWDSCFSAGFARVAGDASFRPRVQDRYRQWLTHKFSTWWDQFGSSGCVGCGRCVAWCPVGIDIREELAAIAPPVPLATAATATLATAATATLGTAALGPSTPSLATAPVGSVIADAIAAPWPASPADGHAPAPLVQPQPPRHVLARLTSSRPETRDTATLRLATDDEALLAARPGQFVMVELPGQAIPPISISGIRPDGLDLTIRAAGPATAALTSLAAGAEVALRGPLGRGWPIDRAFGRDVVIVAGGIGLAPLRPLIETVLAERPRFGAVRLFLGARSPRDRLFVPEIAALAGRADIEVREIVDRAGPEWLGRVGVVTQLFDRAKWDGQRVTAFICGPERMMEATTTSLGRLGVPLEETWLTLERNMACGVGTCGHCQMGPYFVCRDGPVFSMAELGTILQHEGL